MARPLHFYQKKCLREDNRKDEPILNQAPSRRGLEERESPPPGHTVRNKRRPRPSESSYLEKPLKVCSTPQQARGLLSGTNTSVPEEEDLITINIDSSKLSRM